ncbi:MAG TPA: porin family protein [Bacteroidales bacterium]|nr:porin family protein [Bacteroidales bacterium]
MKSIKKITLVALAAVLSISFATAQVGLQAGYSMTKSNDKNAEGMNGFHVGPTYNMTIQGPISLQYGLLYNFVTSEIAPKTTLTNHSFDIPVRVAATFPLTSGLSVFGFAGPNFNIGLADNFKVAIGDNSATTNLYEQDKDRSRFNLQLGLGAGLQYNNMGVKFGYDFGLLDMHKSDAINYKNNGLKAGLFFNF